MTRINVVDPQHLTAERERCIAWRHADAQIRARNTGAKGAPKGRPHGK